MKKTTLPKSIAAIMGLLIVIGVGCSKVELRDKTANEPQYEMMTAEDISVMNKIVAFRNRLAYHRDNPDFKSGEVMSVDSAQWYLDALFNFTYAYTDQTFTSFKTDTFNIVLAKSNGLVDDAELYAAFISLKEQALMVYNETDGDEKELYVSYMNIKHNEENEVVFKVTVTIGARGEGTPPGFSEWGPFAVGDDWMYGELLGDCSIGGGIWFGAKDAATEIEFATNHYRYKYITDNGPGWYAYYTDPSAEVTVTVYGNPSYKNLLLNPNDNVIDNYRDYIILYQEKNPPDLVIETCIPWEDMNFYYHGTRKLIYQIVQDNYDEFEIPANLTFYWCTIEGIGEGSKYDPNYAYHEVSILYRTRHIVITEDERLSLNE